LYQVPPVLAASALDLNDGTLVVTFSETIDSTPTALVAPSLFEFVNQAGDAATHTANLALSASTVVPLDGLTVTLVLSEVERVRAIERSNTPGGDGSALNLTTLPSAVQDMGQNPSVGTRSTLGGTSVHVVETADTTPPRILHATVDLGTKIMVLTCSEYIDSTPGSLIDLTHAYLADNGTAGAPFYPERRPYVVGVPHAVVALHGAAVTAVDGYNVTLQLTETMRVGALFLSRWVLSIVLLLLLESIFESVFESVFKLISFHFLNNIVAACRPWNTGTV
jgi:hypothetical protein